MINCMMDSHFLEADSLTLSKKKFRKETGMFIAAFTSPYLETGESIPDILLLPI